MTISEKIFDFTFKLQFSVRDMFHLTRFKGTEYVFPNPSWYFLFRHLSEVLHTAASTTHQGTEEERSTTSKEEATQKGEGRKLSTQKRE